MSGGLSRPPRRQAEEDALRARLIGAACVGLALLAWWWLEWAGAR